MTASFSDKDKKTVEFWGDFIDSLEKKGLIKEEGKQKLAEIMLTMVGESPRVSPE